MQRGTLTFGAILALFGGWYTVVAWNFPRGTWAQPGPGLYSVLVGLLIMVAALGTMLTSVATLRGSSDTAIAWPAGDGRVRIFGAIGGAAAYIVLLPVAGHIIAAFLACTLIMWTQGDRNWPRLLFWSAVLALVTYFGFVRALGVVFPGHSLIG